MGRRSLPIFPGRLAVALMAGHAAALPPPAADSPFAPELKGFVENFKPNTRAVAYGQQNIFPPQEAVQMLDAPEGYRVELAAHEPQIRQPLDLHFDHRGRLWVVQYIQYPFPAGLKVLEYDGNLRARFDKVSPPPPHHFRGVDRISIHEDTNGDGVYDTHKVFLDGLNLATSMEFDYDGVWVLMSPYLLFYPDRNHDDIPDGDPEVHLAGFNFEDTHSPATSLHWGPDGWLYGAKGSTSTLDIQGIKLLGQGIWRYHPKTGKFEIFAEGGGNTVSLDFDKYGRAFSGTNNPNVRGPHYVQGATYNKLWSKHGPALNPFIFGFFPHMDHQGYAPRFAQAFHLYEGGLFSELEGFFIAGMSIPSRVQPARIVPDTSSFRTVDVDPLIVSRDLAFRPVDLEGGPDGCIYIADWCDVRISNLNPQDTWHKDSGRIYRIVPKNFVRPPQIDVTMLATDELFTLMAHKNRWYREQARRELAVRPEPIEPRLRTLVDRNGEDALEAFWILNLRGRLDTALSLQALRHPNEHIRRWAVRLLGDRNQVDAALAQELVALAKRETVPEVRSQLACSAKRLPASDALPLVRQLLARDQDATDKHIPLLIWWAIENKADSDRGAILAMLQDPAVWKKRIFREFVAERLGRRYTADQGPRKYYTLTHNSYTPWQIDRSSPYLYRNLETAGALLALAPDESSFEALLAGMSEGLTGEVVAAVPPTLRETVQRAWAREIRTSTLVTLAARLGYAPAAANAIALLKRAVTNSPDEQRLLNLVADTAPPDALPVIANMLKAEKNENRRKRLLEALSKYQDDRAAQAVMDAFPDFGMRLKVIANDMLSQKQSWAKRMLQRVADGAFNPGVLSESNEKKILAYSDPECTRLLRIYQQRRMDDPTEREALALFEKGRGVYIQLCALCHQPDGKGQNAVAPSLVASRWVQKGEEAMTRIVLHGKEDGGRGLIMPALKHLGDEAIAAVQVYVLREFGNKRELVRPAHVAQIRTATISRAKSWTDSELERLLGGAANSGPEDLRTVAITANRSIQFSVERIETEAGEKLRIQFQNTSDIPKDRMAHNLVLLKRNTSAASFVAAASAAHNHGYLPPALADQVLGATRLLGPGERDEITVGPLEPGDYAYVATFPGHYNLGMKGVLVVR